jgi:formamidopyrimidine-DNA glycosylase
VGREQDGAAMLVRQTTQQAQDLRLDGDVERGRGFVRDDQRRIRQQGHRDHPGSAHRQSPWSEPCRGMSGSLTFGAAAQAPGKHDHFDLTTSHGVLRLHDPRRFGAVVYASSENDVMATKLLGHLGVEPLEEGFDPVVFAAGLKKRNAPIKQVLLAGELVVGVGNIYASEALFLASIRPTTRASRISKPRAVKLHGAIRDVLARAVAQGGSTLRDFSNAQGQNGYFQLEANVYDRAGEPCRVCTAPIKRLVQGQRSTFFCAVCQKP